MHEKPEIDWESRVALIDRRLAWLAQGGVELTGAADHRARRQIEAWDRQGEDPDTGWVPTEDGGLRWVEPIGADGFETLSNEEVATRLIEQGGWDAGKRIKALAREEPDRAFAIVDDLIERQGGSNLAFLEWVAAGVGETKEAEDFCNAGSRLLRYLDQEGKSDLGGWGFLEWLQSAAKQLTIDREEQTAFWGLWDRLWGKALKRKQSSTVGGADKITSALNAPGGELALALLDRLWKRDLADDAGLPEDLRSRFDALVKGDAAPHLDARLMLASRLVWLYRVDPSWCQQHLLQPMVSFESDDQQAVDLWQAFLWPGQVSSKLWGSLKPALWLALRNYQAFPDKADRLLGFFAAHLLRPGAFDDEMDRKWLDELLSLFGSEQLSVIARQFETHLRARGLEAADSWRTQIAPFIKAHWPLSIDKRSPRLSVELAEMLLQTREAFADTVSLLLEKKPVIGPAEDLFSILYPLSQEEVQPDVPDDPFPYATRFPQQLLSLLDTLIDTEITRRWHDDLLKSLLDEICQSDPSLKNTDEMRRLRTFLRSA